MLWREYAARENQTKALGILIGLSWLLLSFSEQAQVPPRYKVDPFWPKELPNDWMIGHVERVAIDNDGNVWVLNHENTMDHPMDHSDMGLARSNSEALSTLRSRMTGYST